MERGEPADRAGEVGAGYHVILAAVSLEGDGHGIDVDATFPPPLRHRERQRADQAVVDGAVEHARHGCRECAGDLGRQCDLDPIGGGTDVDVRIQLPGRETRPHRFGHRPPQLELVDAVLRGRHEPVRPRPHRRADRREVRVPARDSPVYAATRSGIRIRHDTPSTAR